VRTDATVDGSAAVAIEAQDLKSRRKIILDQPVIKVPAITPTDRITMFVSTTIDMIDGQESQTILTTTITSSAVVINDKTLHIHAALSGVDAKAVLVIGVVFPAILVQAFPVG